MHKKFEINWIKIKGSCQSGRKVVTHDSKSDLPLVFHRPEYSFSLFSPKKLVDQAMGLLKETLSNEKPCMYLPK